MKTVSVKELTEKEKRLETEISDLKYALTLIPADSALANLSLRATIKLKSKKLEEVRNEILKRIKI